MKVTIFQTDIRWADPQENVRQAQQMLTDNPGSDLYVLPEMWATGFATKPQDIAEEEDASVALRWMRQAAQEHDCAICGSLAVRTQDGRYWNRQYFVTPNDVTTYDKHHLFTTSVSPSGRATAGRGSMMPSSAWPTGLRAANSLGACSQGPVPSRISAI